MPTTRVLFDPFCHLLLFHFQSVSEQLFHTRAKPYVSLHPMGYFGNQPQVLQLQELDIEVIHKRGFNSKSPVSSKHQLLCYLWVSYPRCRIGTSACNLKVELLLPAYIHPFISAVDCLWVGLKIVNSSIMPSCFYIFAYFTSFHVIFITLLLLHILCSLGVVINYLNFSVYS